MFSMFRETETAVAYLCSGISKYYSGVAARVTWLPGRGRPPVAMVTEIDGLGGVLTRLCRRFPGASVLFDPNKHTPMAAIQCRCPPHVRQVCVAHCRHHDEIPLASIEFCQSDQPIPAEPNLPLLLAVQRRLHECLLEDRRKSEGHRHSHRDRHGHR